MNTTTKGDKVRTLLMREINKANADGMQWRGYFDQSTHTDENGRDIDYKVYGDYLEINHDSGDLDSWEFVPSSIQTLGELREYLRKCITADTVRTFLINYKTPYESKWDRGVKSYALDLIDCDASLIASTELKKHLLNGADDWHQYSWGGNSLIYDRDIAETLCTPSELKRTRNGERKPNSREEWLDVQARALAQAARLVNYAVRALEAETIENI